MKNNKITFSKIAIVAVLGVATVMGCEKKEVLHASELQRTKDKSAEEVSIEVLRKYFADLVKVPVEHVTYHNENETFRLNGFDQISKKDLMESYQRNFLNR